MRRGKRVVSLLLHVLAPTLGACAISEEGMELEESTVQTEQQEPDQQEFALLRCPLDEPCNPCPIEMALVGLCTPPPKPPTTPKTLGYPSYTSTPSYAVNWGYSTGTGVTYTLEEQVNQGSWQTLYQGAAVSHTVSGRSSALYNYRVRACNYVGCSSYKAGAAMVVNLPPVVNLYSEFPFLSAHDAQNAQYASQNQGFKTGYKTTQQSGVRRMDLTPVDGMFHLGQGFNVLKDTHAQICIDTSHPSFQIVSNPVNARSFTATRAVNVSHLSQLLDVNQSGGISLSGNGYGIDLTGSKKRFNESVGDSYQETIVVRWEKQIDHWTLNTIAEPLKPDFVTNMIIPGNVNAQNRFRERCGDKYVYAVKRGARLYLVFQFDSKSYSHAEREQKSATLALKIKDILNVNGSNAISQETQQFLAQLNVQVKAYAVGGDGNVEVAIDRNNFGTKFLAFVNSVSTTNSAAVEQFVSHYDQPIQFINWAYFQVFADYRGALEQLRRWNALDIEREQRCRLVQSYNYTSDNMLSRCEMGHQELETAKSRCLETLSWSGCHHPLSYYTGNSSGGLPPNTQLYSWLGQNITSLARYTTSNYFDHHEGSGWGNKDCSSYTDDTCLPSSYCVVDRMQGANDGIGQGFSHEEHHWDGPGSGSGKSHSMTTNSWGLACVRTQSTICTSKFGDGTADYRFTQGIFGQCPTTQSFAIVN